MNMKPRYWAALVVAILLAVSTQAQAQMQLPMPPHVRACFEKMALYKQYFIYRGAGLTIEEVRVTNDFSLRVVEFLAKENSREVPPGSKEDLEAMAVEVYGLADEKFWDSDFQEEWGHTKMNECIESSAPPPVENQHRRMIPEKSA